MEITKEITIGKLLDSYPEAGKALLAVGMHCLGCPSARMETLEEAADVHGVDIEELVAAVKACIKK